MARYQMIVHINPTASSDEAFNRWCDGEQEGLSGALAELRARVEDGRMPMSPSLDPEVEFEVIARMDARDGAAGDD